MGYKNIIFDLGNVLVKLNPEGCIGAFKDSVVALLAEEASEEEELEANSN